MSKKVSPARKQRSWENQMRRHRHNGFNGSITWSISALSSPPPTLTPEAQEKAAFIVDELYKLRQLAKTRIDLPKIEE